MFVLSVSINWTILSQKLQKKLLMKIFPLIYTINVGKTSNELATFASIMATK